MLRWNVLCSSWIFAVGHESYGAKNFWVQLWKSWPLDTAGTADWFRDFQTWTRQDQQNSQQFPFSRLITRWLRRDGRTHARCSSTRVERLLLWQAAGSPAPLEMNSLAWRWISGDDGWIRWMKHQCSNIHLRSSNFFYAISFLSCCSLRVWVKGSHQKIGKI